jgi:ABC-type dipeptide/oligopeptide/nickel transport system permease subunit
MRTLWSFLRSEPPAMLGAAWIALWVLVALLGSSIRPDPTPHANNQHLELAHLPPGATAEFAMVEGREISIDSENADRLQPAFKRNYVLGTDRFGRDFLSRLMAGAGLSLAVGCLAVMISLLIGIPLGALAGYHGGRLDAAISWLLQVMWSIPTLLLVLAITLAFGKGFWQVFVAVGITMWVDVARIVRGQVLAVKNLEWVEAGRALGYSSTRIIFKHILPNISGPIAVIAAANFAAAILIEAGLSFLGIGAQIPMPSWGNIIRAHYGAILTGSPHLALLPGAAIMCLVLAFNALSGAMARHTFDTGHEH